MMFYPLDLPQFTHPQSVSGANIVRRTSAGGRDQPIALNDWATFNYSARIIATEKEKDLVSATLHDLGVEVFKTLIEINGVAQFASAQIVGAVQQTAQPGQTTFTIPLQVIGAETPSRNDIYDLRDSNAPDYLAEFLEVETSHFRSFARIL